MSHSLLIKFAVIPLAGLLAGLLLGTIRNHSNLLPQTTTIHSAAAAANRVTATNLPLSAYQMSGTHVIPSPGEPNASTFRNVGTNRDVRNGASKNADNSRWEKKHNLHDEDEDEGDDDHEDDDDGD